MLFDPRLALVLALLPLAFPSVSGSVTSLNLTVVGQVSVTHHGCRITGHELSLTSGEDGGSLGSLFRFLGVPYAEPPTGERRFAQPAPFNFSQRGSVNATMPPVTCPHVHALESPYSVSEDCLFLSLSSPNISASGKKLPVLALLTDPEEAGDSAGDALAALGNLVVVTVAYRAGALGFLGVGNPGLADQHLALEFVRDAIALFGGDPTRVVLAGHGPGAAATVGVHAVGAAGSTVAFRAVVMMSGSIASPLAWTQSPNASVDLGRRLANLTGCGSDLNEERLACLRKLPSLNVTTAEAVLVAEGHKFAPVFQPVGGVDDDNSSLLISRWRGGAFNGSLLIGAAADIGAAVLRDVIWETLDNVSFENLLGREFRHFPRLHSATNPTGLRYLGLTLADWPHANYGPAVRPQLTRTVGDFHAVCPVWRAAADLAGVAGAGGVFVYSFDAAAAANDTRGRAADARYLLGEPLLLRAGDDPLSARHRNLSRVMMDHLAAFVHDGAPNTNWPRTSTYAFEFMKFEVASDSAVALRDLSGFGFGPGRCPFWSGEIPLTNGLWNSTDATPPPTPPPPPPPPPLSILGNDATAFPQSFRPGDVALADYSVRVISFGTINGKTIRSNTDVTMSQFLGIPYAKPPVGHLRFANPEKLDTTSSSIHMAQSLQPVCMQQETQLPISEDCLYLNLWTPLHSGQGVSNLPVLVFLHGGFFRTGGIASTNWLASPVLYYNSVVAITVSYRLGAFGFLALPQGADTNVGLRDQQMALDWIFQSVDRFGGARAKVTLIGTEAGAASVGYLLARPPLRFQRAVMLTGSPYLSYATASAKQLRSVHATFVANYLNCADTAQQLSCLQAINASVIITKQADFLRDRRNGSGGGAWWPIGGVFAPVVDDDFIRADPLAAPPAGLASVPLLLGGVDAPGNHLLTEWLPEFELSNLTRAKFLELLDQSLGYFPNYPEMLSPTGRQAVWLRFTSFLSAAGQREDPTRDGRLLAEALGNRHYTCPNWKFLAEAAAGAGSQPVYGFVFAEDSNVTALKGASLFEDAYYALGNPAVRPPPLGEERAGLSKALMQSIARFADSGAPGWPPYDRNTRQVRLLTSKLANNAILIQDEALPGLECAFWKRTLPCVDSPDCILNTPTTPPPEMTSVSSGSATTPEGPTTSGSTVSSAEPPLTTSSPDGGGAGLGTLALVLIIVFSVVGAALLAAAAFLVYKFRWLRRDYQQQPVGQELRPAGGGAPGQQLQRLPTGSGASGQQPQRLPAGSGAPDPQPQRPFAHGDPMSSQHGASSGATSSDTNEIPPQSGRVEGTDNSGYDKDAPEDKSTDL